MEDEQEGPPSRSPVHSEAEEDEMPAHLSQWSDSTDLSKPIFMLSDDLDNEDEQGDPFREDDPALQGMLAGTTDWTADQDVRLQGGDPFAEVGDSATQSAKREDIRDLTQRDSPAAAVQETGEEGVHSDGGQQGNAKEKEGEQPAEKEKVEKGKEKETDLAVLEEEVELQPDDGSGERDAELQEEGNGLRDEAEGRFRGELMRQSVDLVRLRHLCKTYGIPDGLRGDIWKHLLGAEKQPSNPMNGWSGDIDEREHLVLLDACKNTRPELQVFREEGTFNLVSRILAFYCERRTVKYRPGLNELLAPFVMLGLPEGIVFNCYYAFLSKYLPVLFTTDETVEPCLYELFRLLMLYHDPELCGHLDQNNLRPQRVLASWFDTFFASVCSIDVSIALWDFIFILGDPFMHYFIALALLTSKRDALLPLFEKDSILIVLSRIHLHSKGELDHLIKKAQYYESTTPKSFRQQLFSTTYHTNEFNTWIRRYLYARSSFSVPTCLQVSVAEVVHAATTTEAGLKFFVFDCRPLEQYNAGRLPTAFHLPPRMLLEKPEDFRKLLSGFVPLKGNHFCFFGGGQSELETYLELIVLQFLQKGFQHVSVVHGGYEALHTLLQARDRKGIELADHDPTACLICVNQHKQPQQPQPQPQPQPTPQKAPSPAPTRRGSGLFPIPVIPSIEAKIPLASNVPLTSSLISNFGSSLASSISMVREKSSSLTTNLTTTFKHPPATPDVIPSIISALKDEKKKPPPPQPPEPPAEEKGPMPVFTIDDDDDKSDDEHDKETDNTKEEGDKDTTKGEPDKNEREEPDTDGPETKTERSTEEPADQKKVEQVAEARKEGGMLSSLSASNLKSLIFWSKTEETPKPEPAVKEEVRPIAEVPKSHEPSIQPEQLPEMEMELAPAEILVDDLHDDELEIEDKPPGLTQREIELEREREQNFKRENALKREKERQQWEKEQERKRLEEEPQQPRPAPTAVPPKQGPPPKPTSPTPARRTGGWFSWWSSAPPPTEPNNNTATPTSPSIHSYKMPLEYENYVPYDEYVESHPAWEFFSCKKALEDGELHGWHLAVTPTQLIELKTHPTQKHMIQIQHSHPLPAVTKITFKKTNPNLLTFEFEEQERQQFFVDRAMECIRTVRKAIEKCLQDNP